MHDPGAQCTMVRCITHHDDAGWFWAMESDASSQFYAKICEVRASLKPQLLVPVPQSTEARGSAKIDFERARCLTCWPFSLQENTEANTTLAVTSAVAQLAFMECIWSAIKRSSASAGTSLCSTLIPGSFIPGWHFPSWQQIWHDGAQRERSWHPALSRS